MDPKGNRKQHSEEIIEKNGKCEKYVHDIEWDSKGNKIRDVEKTTEVPCGKYYLEVAMEGIIPFEDGEIHWGPEKATITLRRENGIYTGTYRGQFKAVGSTHNCSDEVTYPEYFEVTAKENEFGDLGFSVNHKEDGFHGMITCNGDTEIFDGPPFEEKLTFTLPVKDGASWSTNDGVITWTYTLRENKSQ
jgi:hypothetical protein